MNEFLKEAAESNPRLKDNPLGPFALYIAVVDHARKVAEEGYVSFVGRNRGNDEQKEENPEISRLRELAALPEEAFNIALAGIRTVHDSVGGPLKFICPQKDNQSS